MNWKLLWNQVGKLLVLIGLSMLLPLALSAIDGDERLSAFIIGFFVTTISGALVYLLTRQEGVMHNLREGFMLVALGWILASLFGCLPMYLSGCFPSFLDAFFETLSGFTATGVTIVDNIEALPRSILLWRSLTQWLGGMGIVVLFVALLTGLGSGGMQLLNAEITGPVKEKIRPRISDGAKSLWYIYVALTGLTIIMYYIAGMNAFDAINHGLTTIATGGYSTKNQSMGSFSSTIQWVSIIFMFIAGFSFAKIYSAISKRKLSSLWKNSEIRLYIFIICLWTLLLFLDLMIKESLGATDALRLALFNVVSIITTTGYIIYDFDEWSFFAQNLILFLMLTGACAGSTSGGIKLQRLLILFKQTKFELLRILHPRMVTTIKINKQIISPRVVENVSIFISLYFFILFLATLLGSWFGLPFMEAFSTAVTCLGNGGPAFGSYGPTESFSALPSVLKAHSCFLMLIGRLEIFTLLVAFIPFNSKKIN